MIRSTKVIQFERAEMIDEIEGLIDELTFDISTSGHIDSMKKKDKAYFRGKAEMIDYMLRMMDVFIDKESYSDLQSVLKKIQYKD